MAGTITYNRSQAEKFLSLFTGHHCDGSLSTAFVLSFIAAARLTIHIIIFYITKYVVDWDDRDNLLLKRQWNQPKSKSSSTSPYRDRNFIAIVVFLL